MEIGQVSAKALELKARAVRFLEEEIWPFERELADPSLLWMRWQHDGYEPFQLPPPGKSVLLPRIDFFDLLFSSRA